jgi:FMN phosphatase YigB (HAD superfamily)
MTMIALVDFGNTLADQTFFRRNCEKFPTWTRHYVPLVNQLRPDWDTGRISSGQLAERIASQLAVDAGEVHAYMRELCTTVNFYPAINRAVRRRRARGGRQALVTVNPDIFSEVAAHYALHDHFDAIVTSWEHGVPDKAELCRRALNALGSASPADSVLIDDLETNVQAWVTEGGRGYLFRDDETFAKDVIAGRLPAFTAADLRSAGPERP